MPTKSTKTEATSKLKGDVKTMDKIRKANKRNFFIAQNMIFDLNISEHAKLVYLYLCRCADDESQAFPSYNTIAKKCSFSRMTAIRAIQTLQEIGLLSVKKRKIRKNGKLLNTSNLYILYDSPNEGVVSESDQGSTTQIPPLVSESDQGGIREIPNKYPVINTNTDKDPSIYQENTENQESDVSDDGLMDGLNSKVEELETMGYENMESIKGALDSLWKYGVSGQELQTVRKHFSLINYETIDTALYRFEEEYNKKKIQYPVKYLAACIYNAIPETDIHSFIQA